MTSTNDLDFLTIRTLRGHVAMLERQLRDLKRENGELACERDLLAMRARKLGLSSDFRASNDVTPNLSALCELDA